MNRAQRRAFAADARRSGSWAWKQKSLDEMRSKAAMFPAVRNIRAFHFNDFYSVQVYDVQTEWGEVVHLIVREHMNREPPWRDLQRIKDELVGEDRTAVHVHPAACDLVDNADVYHLFVLPEGRELPFGLHRANGLTGGAA